MSRYGFTLTSLRILQRHVYILHVCLSSRGMYIYYMYVLHCMADEVEQRNLWQSHDRALAIEAVLSQSLE